MKKISFILGLFFVLSLLITAQEMQSGSWRANYTERDFTLNEGEGERILQREVRFAKPFESMPDISVFVANVDADKNINLRYDAKAIGISRDGFVLRIKTWSNSKVYGIGGFWFAQAEKLEIEEEKIEVGQTVELKNVFFEFNKSALLPDSYTELNKVADFLKDNPTVEIELAGHTDNVGASDYNMDLSEKRAQSVKEYLVAQGISENRLSAKGYGMTKPVAPNDYDWGREKNRRVEFTILKK